MKKEEEGGCGKGRGGSDRGRGGGESAIVYVHRPIIEIKSTCEPFCNFVISCLVYVFMLPLVIDFETIICEFSVSLIKYLLSIANSTVTNNFFVNCDIIQASWV